MNLHLLAENRQPPSVILAKLMDEHGVLRVLGAVLKALVRRDPSKRDLFAEDLSGHLRRDIGLSPQAEARRHWDLL
ncbi:MAG TPA: hypothetical protein PK450_02630 [Paracoccaceae bacterium]|nr:hypothetical protein [Paracoccaceae bacterium]